MKEPTETKTTPGEELYLVHLRRSFPEDDEDLEDDHDVAVPRKRSRSLGEELYNIHLKRMEGISPEYDAERLRVQMNGEHDVHQFTEYSESNIVDMEVNEAVSLANEEKSSSEGQAGEEGNPGNNPTGNTIPDSRLDQRSRNLSIHSH